MGFLDRLFKFFGRGPTPVEREVQKRIAIRRTQRFIDKLNAQAAELTAEYAERWEEAKQYLKIGKIAMAKQCVRWCLMLKIGIDQYEKQSAVKMLLLDKMESAATTEELFDVFKELVGDQRDELPCRIDFGGLSDDFLRDDCGDFVDPEGERMMRELEQEVEAEMREQAARHLEAGQTEMAEQVLREWCRIKARIDEYYNTGAAPAAEEQSRDAALEPPEAARRRDGRAVMPRRDARVVRARRKKTRLRRKKRPGCSSFR